MATDLAAGRRSSNASLQSHFDHSLLIELGMRSLHHPRTEEIELEDILHALSDPVRLKIVEAIADRHERNCSSVEASVSKSTLSHHFKVLREAGVTHTRANGTQRLISLRRGDLEERFPGLLDSILAAARSVSRVTPRV
jgi:DNA-binding transcriptional ArsR family regulator